MNPIINTLIRILAVIWLITATNILAQTRLDTSQVKKLFSDNTVHSLHLIRGHETTLYYNPDGRFYGISDGSIHQGKWEVQDDGSICLIFESGKSRCRLIMKENDVYYKYRIKDNGEVKKIIEYKRFTPGNPNNYQFVN